MDTTVDSERTVKTIENCAQGILTETMEKSRHPSLDSTATLAPESTSFATAQTVQIVSENLTFRVRHFMAQLCRAESQRQVFNTIEFLYDDVKTFIALQIRDRPLPTFLTWKFIHR